MTFRRTRALLKYTAHRILVLVPLLIGVTFVSFALVRIGQESPAVLIAGPQAGPEEIEAVEREWGFDQPFATQYWTYLKQVAHGDFGNSWVTQQPVAEEVRNRLPITLELVIIGTLLSAIVGVALGFAAAVNQGGITDHVLRVVTLLGVAAPIFLTGIMLIYVFFSELNWVPAPLGGGPVSSAIFDREWRLAGENARLLILPVATILIAAGCVIAKQARATIAEVVASEAARYARACGLPTRAVWGLILRNSLPGLITFIGISVNFVLGGSALVELIYSFGGLGEFGLRAVTQSDFAVVQAYILVVGIIMAGVYLLTDIAVALADPRVTYS